MERDPGWSLGNIARDPLRLILNNGRRGPFLGPKPALAGACRECRFVLLCQSGCPRHRAPGDPSAPDTFCAAYTSLFEVAAERLSALADRCRRRQSFLAATGGRVARTASSCPCGSGRGVKDCCGDPRYQRCYLFAEPERR
jgi:radical SAM protein with 4Fe4S-binding SPASM domain